MSLDVWLLGGSRCASCQCSRCGHQHERDDTPEVYEANITHNLGMMADKAGLYECLWRPDEHNLVTAGQLIEPMRAGLAKLKADPSYFQQFNPENGWGSYDGFVRWVERYLEACEEFPDSLVKVSR